jgi:hypothetical protein
MRAYTLTPEWALYHTTTTKHREMRLQKSQSANIVTENPSGPFAVCEM